MTVDEIHFEELIRAMRKLREQRIQAEHDLAVIDFQIRRTEIDLNYLLRHGVTENYNHGDVP